MPKSKTGLLAVTTLMLTQYFALPLKACGEESSSTQTSDAHLESVVVQGRFSEADKARVRLEETPGAARVIDNKEAERGRAQNAEDVFAFQPGIYAQSVNGSGANKISIRGSGLNSYYGGYVMGIKFLYDGMPLSGVGGTQEDMLNMAAVDHTEVLYGANAFDYTALALGGAVNMVTRSGRTSPGTRIRLDGGSHGYRKEEFSYGGQNGDSDYFLAVLRNQTDGFQDDTPSHGKDLIANFGHRFGPRLTTRIILRYRDEQLFNGSTLTRQDATHHPRRNEAISDRRKKGTTLLNAQGSYTFGDDSVLEFGLGYNDYPLRNGWKYFEIAQDWRSSDLNTVLRYRRSGDRLFGLPNDLRLTFSDSRLVTGDVKGYRQTDRKLVRYTDYGGSRDTVLALSDDLHLSDRLTLSGGLSADQIDRSARIKYSLDANTSTFPDHVDYKKWHLAPRLGLSYQLSPEVQLFGNVSRSLDPPVTWQHGSTANPYLRPLDPQKGITGEIGTRFFGDAVQGSLALYRSWIKDELLNVVIVPASAGKDEVTANSNASATIHQGVEAGLQTRLWQSAQGSRLNWQQAWTFNDFFYRNDRTFGHNQLPSLPRQYYQSELLYQQAKGFYAGINLKAASGYYVDYANSLRAPGYALFGAKIGYDDPGERFSLSLDARNLTAKRYVTAASTAYDLKGVDSAYFYPGDGRSLFASLAVRF